MHQGVVATKDTASVLGCNSLTRRESGVTDPNELRSLPSAITQSRPAELRRLNRRLGATRGDLVLSDSHSES